MPSASVAEQSYIVSPCFDFTGVEKPMVSMDIYKSLENGKEGVVLQAKVDTAMTWKTIGIPGDGINWYDTLQIESMPAGQAKWMDRKQFIWWERWMDPGKA